MENIEKILESNIRTRRKSKKLTQEALAERAGVSMFTVQAYESGRRWPELPTLSKIADALDVPVAKLFQASPQEMDKDEVFALLAEKMGFEITKKN